MSLYVNRTLCEVLEEMRACFKTRNFASLSGLIEETQSMGNKMEAKLNDIADVKRYTEQRKDLYNEVGQLQKDIEKLEQKREDLKDD